MKKGKRFLALLLALTMLVPSGMTSAAGSMAQETGGTVVSSQFEETEASGNAENKEEANESSAPEEENQNQLPQEEDEEASGETQSPEDVEEDAIPEEEAAEEENAEEGETVTEDLPIADTVGGMPVYAALSVEELEASKQEILYFHRLYPESGEWYDVRAEFWVEDPFVEVAGSAGEHKIPEKDEEGNERYSQYMTKVQDDTYGVVLPEDKESGEEYSFVRFSYKLEEGGGTQYVRTVYMFKGDPLSEEELNHNTDLAYLAFAPGIRNCIYAGKSGSRSYVDRNPSGRYKLIGNQSLYLNMKDSEYVPFTDASNPDKPYLKLYYGDGAKDFIKVENKVGDDLWALDIPKDLGLTSITRFSLRDKRYESEDEKTKSLGETRFYYKLTEAAATEVEEPKLLNQITPANLLKNDLFWSNYKASKPTGEKREILFNSFLANLKDVDISWSDDNGTNWSNWTPMEKGTGSQGDSWSLRDLWVCEVVPTEATHVKFRGNKAGDLGEKPQGEEKSYTSDSIEITDAYARPCWYAYRKAWSDKNDPERRKLGGYWSTKYSINRSGDNGVEIKQGEFTRDETLYYAETDFYDYYGDAELFGRKAWEGDAISSAMYNLYAGYAYNNKYRQAPILNNALSAHYKELDGKTGATPEEGTIGQKHAIYFGSNGVGFYRDLYGVHLGESRNEWDGSRRYTITKGIMDSKLNANGMPTQNDHLAPVFDEEWLRGNNSYDTALGQVYRNVDFPFRKEGNYWVFDSAAEKDGKPLDAVQLKDDPDSGYYLEKTENGLKNTNNGPYGFFPLDDVETLNPNGDKGGNEERNFMFGMKMSVPFTLNESKTIKHENAEGTIQEDPITFTFSGDDDVWIYVDGKLVVDLGGLHDAAQATINFQNGKVTYTRANSDISIPGQDTTLEWVQTLDPNEPHTLTMFYMERGLTASNMKVSFNFFVENKLTVTNTIKTAGNEFFKAAQENIGALNYKIYNQATDGEKLPVSEAAGGVILGTPDVFNDGTGEIKTVTEQPTEEGKPKLSAQGNVEYNDGTESVKALEYKSTYPEIVWEHALDAERQQRSAKISGETVVLKGSDPETPEKAYLRMLVNSSESSPNGGELHVKFTGSNGEIYGCTADTATYDNNNNSLYANTWSVVRIDLTEVKEVMDEVEYISIGYSKPATLYIKDIEFYEKLELNDMLGFAVEPEMISDYGSIDAGESAQAGFQSHLSPVGLAGYKHYLEGNDEEKTSDSYTDVNGRFSLANNQRAVFTDKFRPGSYLHLHEDLVAKNTFLTTYSVSERQTGEPYQNVERESLLPGRFDVETVKNNEEITNLTNVKGTSVKDGRTALRNGGQEFVQNKEGSPDACEDLTDTMVYRSYKNPDRMAGSLIDLKVDFVNEVLYGDIVIDKEIVFDGENAGVDKWAFVDRYNASANKITFTLEFFNIMGRYLERQTPEQLTVTTAEVKELKLNDDGTVTGTATFTGIPAGTHYKITENPYQGMVSNGMTWGTNAAKAEQKGERIPHTNLNNPEATEENPDTKIYTAIEGIVYESVQHFNATNTYEPQITLNVWKQWEGAQPEEAKQEVKVTLQRSTDGGEYENVYISAQADVETAIGSDIVDDPDSGKLWQKTTKDLATSFENLPISGEIGGRTVTYNYRVVEETPEGYFPIYRMTEEAEEGAAGAVYLITIINVNSEKEYYVRRNEETELPEFVTADIDLAQYEIKYESLDSKRNHDRITLEEDKAKFWSAETGAAKLKVTLVPQAGGDNIVFTVIVNVYDLGKDIYVLDYGLPAKLADSDKKILELKNGMFGNDTYAISEKEGTSAEFAGVSDKKAGSYADAAKIENGNGHLDVAQNGDTKTPEATTVTFTPDKFMDRIDYYYYKTIVREPESAIPEIDITPANGVVMTEEIKVMPASVVYYEDNFTAGEGETSENGIIYSGQYQVEGIAYEKSQSIDLEEAYGYDAAYQDGNNDPGMTDSLGSSTALNSADGFVNNGKAEFTFTGTGFDIVGRADNKSLIVGVQVFAEEDVTMNGKTYKKGQIVRATAIDTFYEADETEAIYQVPMIAIHDLAHAKYKVVVKAIYRKLQDGSMARFYMDGIRIYNPLGENTEDYREDEKNAQTLKVWNMILGDTEISEQGTLEPGTKIEGATAALVYSDGVNAKNIFELGTTTTEVPGVGDSTVGTGDLNDYLVSGPKHELYLPEGSAIAFVVKERAGAAAKTLQIEAKAVNSNQSATNESATQLSNVKTNATTTDVIEIPSTTGMYYKLDLDHCLEVNGGKLVVLANTSTNNAGISLTNLKVNGYELSYPPTAAIQKLPPIEDVNEDAIKVAYQNYVKEIPAEPAEGVKVIDAQAATPFVRNGDSMYLNVTLQMEHPEYVPFVLLYDKTSDPAAMKEAVVDNTTLRPIRDYETENGTCYVFKVKVDLSDGYENDKIYSFAVGATNPGKTKHNAASDCKVASVWVRGTDWDPTATVENGETPTNQDVVVTLHTGDEIYTPDGWTKADDRTYTKAYGENGTYEVVVEDLSGYQSRAEFTISNIDKAAPEAEVEIENQNSKSALVTLRSNEAIREVDGWTKVDEQTYETICTENGENAVTIRDLASNETVVHYTVAGIAEEKPEETPDADDHSGQQPENVPDEENSENRQPENIPSTGSGEAAKPETVPNANGSADREKSAVKAPVKETVYEKAEKEPAGEKVTKPSQSKAAEAKTAETKAHQAEEPQKETSIWKMICGAVAEFFEFIVTVIRSWFS